MKRKQTHNLLFLVLLFSFFAELWIGEITDISKMMRLTEKTVTEPAFREMNIDDRMLAVMKRSKNRGLDAAIWLLESRFGYQKISCSYTEEDFRVLKKKWEKRKAWEVYLKICQAIWEDVRYFPVPVMEDGQKGEPAFENSWGQVRTYGGKRWHEGTDIMPPQNIRGYYPVVSMTDGTVESKGWLPKGGYRVGVRAPSGGYFYYAHLDSYADIKEGDKVRAGDILGFMGDSGYGEEGTRGKFPVHLHVGIYVYPKGEEISVNPYRVLRFLENRRLTCKKYS